jgi:hypothetical protein
MSREPRQPLFEAGDAVTCADADAREYAGVVISHYAGRAGHWYAVGIEELEAVLHFPESRMRKAEAAADAAGGLAAE